MIRSLRWNWRCIPVHIIFGLHGPYEGLRDYSLKMQPNFCFRHSIFKIRKILDSIDQKKLVGRHQANYAALGRHHGFYVAIGRHNFHDAALGPHNFHDAAP